MGSVLHYFNLNRRKPDISTLFAPDMSGLDRGAGAAAEEAPEDVRRKPGKAGHEPRRRAPEQKPMPLWEQIVMYVGVVAGVALSGAVQQFKAGTPVSMQFTWGTVALSAVVGLLIIPQVFDKLKVGPSAPLIVKLGLFVQNGVFWQVIFTAIGKAM